MWPEDPRVYKSRDEAQKVAAEQFKQAHDMAGCTAASVNRTIRSHLYQQMADLEATHRAVRELLDNLPASYLDSPVERLLPLFKKSV